MHLKSIFLPERVLKHHRECGIPIRYMSFLPTLLSHVSKAFDDISQDTERAVDVIRLPKPSPLST